MINDNTEKMLGAVETALCEAVKNRDRDVLNKVLSDDFIATGHAGNVVDKAKYMEIHLSSTREFTVFDTSETIYRIYGDAAILMGEIRIVNAKMPEKKDPPKRYTAVYIRNDDDWKCAAWQETPIQTKEKF